MLSKKEKREREVIHRGMAKWKKKYEHLHKIVLIFDNFGHRRRFSEKDIVNVIVNAKKKERERDCSALISSSLVMDIYTRLTGGEKKDYCSIQEYI
mmetsp:Transcript_36106/g.41103  ORF Transcript_36106/g.41103 Transcript_36106/m.41103 type:complete len:96 (+) Transcript_36106:300-587(+)